MVVLCGHPLTIRTIKVKVWLPLWLRGHAGKNERFLTAQEGWEPGQTKLKRRGAGVFWPERELYMEHRVGDNGSPIVEIDIDSLASEFRQRDLELVKRTRLGDETAKEEIYKAYAAYVENFLRKEFESQFWGLMTGTVPRDSFDDVGIRDDYLSTDLEDAVADAVTDTFLRAFEYLETYDPERSLFVTWLFTIAKNVLRNKLREIRHRHKQMFFVEVEPEHLLHLPTSRDDPERLLISRETRREKRQVVRARVHEVLGSLTPNQAKALWLRYGFGLKVKDVAEQMGLSEDAAESLIRRGRKAVFKKWGSELGLDT